jgi:hypothetical protein
VLERNDKLLKDVEQVVESRYRVGKECSSSAQCRVHDFMFGSLVRKLGANSFITRGRPF